MTPEALLARRTAPLRLVIFDCDGVLVDSEAVAARVCAAEITKLGWPMTGADSLRLFVGMNLSDMRPLIEDRIGRPLPLGWVHHLADRLAEALAAEAVLIDGARETLEATSALGLDWRIASNSGPEELEAKFARTGLSALVAGRVHSASEVIAVGGRGKPAPDLFLAAARASGASPGHCLVIEDSVPGITAARSAGMDCIAYAPHGDGAHLIALGAAPIRSLHALPALLRRRLAAAA